MSTSSCYTGTDVSTRATLVDLIQKLYSKGILTEKEIKDFVQPKYLMSMMFITPEEFTEIIEQ